MMTRTRPGRRALLHGAGLVAATAALVGCSEKAKGPGRKAGRRVDQGEARPVRTGKGSSTEPLKPPGRYAEAPMLAAKVRSGELPRVEDRLPARPYVVPHKWLETGKYGGQLLMVTDTSDTPAIKVYMYGYSILRWLNDGQDIGPGLAESWESNDDATEWTFHFREGLKWSDGHPWSTADIMYWWEDMVLNKDEPALVPDDVRSGRDSVAEVTAPDDLTLRLVFDSPAPVTAERLAAWVNGGTSDDWPNWMVPKHYLKQFHPKYNPAVTRKDWYVKHDQMGDWQQNPACPTMTGWRCQSYRDGRSVVLERNPYYWCVDREGNQLPYIDELNFTVTQDPQVQRLQMTQGKVDYVHGSFLSLSLADVSGFKASQKDSHLAVRYWDSGSGSSLVFFNRDYPEESYRSLFRNAAFQRALSHALNRPDMQRSLYFNTGEPTTGTLSPKGVTFNVNDEGRRIYKEWRDSYVKYDPAKAKKLLDGIGVVDKDGDGMRELPDGSKLKILLEYPADESELRIQVASHFQRDWKAVGVDAEPSPVSPDAFLDRWGRGVGMTRADSGIGDNNPLVYPDWIVPVANDYWSPLTGEAYVLQTSDPGKLKSQTDRSPWDRQPPWILPSKGSLVDRLWDLLAQARVEADAMKRIHIEWEIFKIHINEGPFMIGTIANYPQLVLVRDGLKNVPERKNLWLGGWVGPWIIPSPAVYDPETYCWEEPAQHAP